MNDTPAIARRFRAGRFIVTFSVPTPPLGQTTLTLVCEWSPHLPASLTARELRQYAAGRDRAIADLTEAMVASAQAKGLLMGNPGPSGGGFDGECFCHALTTPTYAATMLFRVLISLPTL